MRKFNFYYQSKARFNNNPVEVFVLEETEKMAKVQLMSFRKEMFWVRKSSLY